MIFKTTSPLLCLPSETWSDDTEHDVVGLDAFACKEGVCGFDDVRGYIKGP